MVRGCAGCRESEKAARGDYSRALLDAVERRTRIILSRHFDAHPPKMGDYCGEAAAASAERLLQGGK